MTMVAPSVIRVRDCRISFMLLVERPKARLTIGSINGATIIAPITVAALFSIKPTVAMMVEMINRTKNSRFGCDAWLLSSRTDL